MIPSGLFSQIALIALSIGIIFTYIKPAFGDISLLQEQIAVYQEERGKVSGVNAALDQKMQVINAIFDADKDRLMTYLPDLVDPLAVMRDLEIIAGISGVLLGDIVDSGPVETTVASYDPYAQYDPTATVDSLAGSPYAYSFSLNVDGSYSQIKELVQLIEQNNYPLEIQEITIQNSDGGFLSAEILLYSYSQTKYDPKEVELFQDVNVTYE